MRKGLVILLLLVAMVSWADPIDEAKLYMSALLVRGHGQVQAARGNIQVFEEILKMAVDEDITWEQFWAQLLQYWQVLKVDMNEYEEFLWTIEQNLERIIGPLQP